MTRWIVPVQTAGHRGEHAPSAFCYWLLALVTLHDGAPVEGDVIYVQPDLGKHVGADLGDRGDAWHVGGTEEEDFLAVVAGRDYLLPHGRKIDLRPEILHPDVGGVDRAGG